MALKRISTSEAQLGMYVHAFDGNWFSHPFWRARFVIKDSRQLAAIRESRVSALVIDTELGSTTPPDDAGTVTATPPFRSAIGPGQRQRGGRPPAGGPAETARVPFPPRQPASGPVSVKREFGNARIVIGKAQKIVSKVFLEARLGKAPRLAEVVPVVEDIFASIQRNPYAFSGLMRCKADAEVAYRHSISVSALMVSLARQLRLSPKLCREAGMCGLLHDIGVSQLALDLETLMGKFDTMGGDLLQRHVYVAYDLLRAAGDIPEAVLNCVLHHHERIDGSGFPQGLSGIEIDLFSRMAAICDTYDHLVTGAIDGNELDPATAMARLLTMNGALDPQILPRFMEMMGVYPIGSFVTLRSERLAMVIDQDPESPGSPVVRAFYSLAQRRHTGTQTIALAHCYGEDEIVGVADFTDLDLPPPQKLRETLLAATIRER